MCIRDRVKEAVLRSEESHGILVITTTESKEDVLDLSRVDGAEHCSKKECAGVITDTIAQVLYDLVQEMDGRVGGCLLYTSDVYKRQLPDHQTGPAGGVSGVGAARLRPVHFPGL